MADIIWKGERRPQADMPLVIMSISNGDTWVNLPLYLNEVNHSPTGFEWGFWGSGAAQLAYAILRTFEELFACQDKKYAKAIATGLHQQFKQDVIAEIQTDEWVLSSEQVRVWMKTQLSRTRDIIDKVE